MSEVLHLDDILTDYGRLPCNVCTNSEICEMGCACNDFAYYLNHGAYRMLDRNPHGHLYNLIFSTDEHVQARV